MSKAKKRPVEVVIYQAEPDMPTEAPTFIAFLWRWHKHKGKTTFDMLPIRFHGEERVELEKKALAFWDDLVAKEKAKVRNVEKFRQRTKARRKT